jgi:hypothetical protein
MHKLNIGMKDNPKLENIGDYWNEETVEKIVNFLRKNQEFFPTTFFKNGKDCWGAKGDEDPFEFGCQKIEAEIVPIEPNI